MRCLILYYSFTGQAERAALIASEAARSEGWEPVLCRITMTEPADAMERPFRIADAKRWTQGAQKGAVVPIAYEPSGAIDGDHDAVLLFTNTWGGEPSVPVNSFLRSEAAKAVLGSKPFAVFVVCRRLWKKNRAKVRALGEAAGGQYIGGEAFMHSGSQIGSLMQTVSYLFRSDLGMRKILGIRLPPYGLSDAALARIPAATCEMLDKAAQSSSQTSVARSD